MSFHFLKFGFVFSLLLLLVTCKEVSDGEEPVPQPPVLQLDVQGAGNVSEVTVDVGDTVFFSAEAGAEAGIKSLVSYVTTGGNQKMLFQLSVDSAMTEATIDDLNYYFDYTFSGKDVSFLVLLTDELDQVDSAGFTVHVNVSEITVTEDIELGAYDHASVGNFYNILSDTAYFPNNLRTSIDNQQGVDFIVSFNTDTHFSIAAPDDPDAPTIWDKHVSFGWPFQVRNNTRFVALDATFDYDAIVTAAQLDEVFSGDGLSRLSSLSRGQFIAFRLDSKRNEKIGVMEVVDFTGKTDAERKIIFNLKIQK